MSNTNVRLDRLRKVVQALREVPREQKSKFTMVCFVHSCGTPGCALGHFAARRDLQRAFKIVKSVGRHGQPIARAYYRGDWDLLYASRDYFGLSCTEAEDLFGTRGCGDAKTPIQAARYIERFIKKQEKEQSK
jgi:hypothetical protein